MDLRHAFAKAVQERGTQEVFHEGGRWVRLGEIAVQALAMADLIEKSDTSETGNVGILLPNTCGFVSSFYGAMLAGRTPVPLNPMFRPPELAFVVDNAGIRVVLTASPLKPQVEAMKAELKREILVIHLDELAAGMDAAARAAMAEKYHPSKIAQRLAGPPREVACMIYSSGTTGLPKGVMLTHANLQANIDAVCRRFSIGPEQTMSGLMPFFHSFGLVVMLLIIGPGGRLVLMPRFVAGDVLRSVTSEKITMLLLVPPLWQALLRNDALRSVDWPSLQICFSGGGPLPGSLREAWQKATGVPLCNGYGMTEHSPAIALEIPQLRRDGSVGRPLDGVELRFLGDDGRDVGVGEEGEILARSASVMKGYYGNEKATRETVDAEGWLHSGDYGKQDADGFLYITGRKKDIIVVAGENVHPEEIEDALAAHPAIAEIAVIGVPDETRGEAAKAFVVLKPDAKADAHELRAYARERLAPFKVPRDFVFATDLPRNTLGKPLRRELRKWGDKPPEPAGKAV